MYYLSMNISIRPLLDDCTSSILDSREIEVVSILRAFGFEPKCSRFYFHPDEESEMRGIEFEGTQIHIEKGCKKPQSVVHLSQIIFSLCALFSSYRFSYSAEVEELSMKDK